MSNRIDLTQFEEISPAETWEVIYPDRLDRICVATGEALYHPHVGTDDYNVRRANMALMAAGPDLLAELKRYYGFVDELLTYFHHTILEDESFMDLMYRMGHFERD